MSNHFKKEERRTSDRKPVEGHPDTLYQAFNAWQIHACVSGIFQEMKNDTNGVLKNSSAPERFAVDEFCTGGRCNITVKTLAVFCSPGC